MMHYLEGYEAKEVDIYIKTPRVQQLLLQDDYLAKNDAFKEICYLMNNRNGRKKWSILGE